jgi:nucleoside-diphosphate-sugar epimerase
MHLEANIHALTAATGWQPIVPLEQGLAETVAWHRKEKTYVPHAR